MRVWYLFCCLICTVNYSAAQVIVQDEGQVFSASNFGFIRSDQMPNLFLSSDNRILNYSEIKGTPYVDNQQDLKFNKTIGQLYGSDLKLIDTVFIRYNAYTDNMELSLLDDGLDYYLLKKQANSWYVFLGNHKYRAYNYQTNDDFKLGYFNILLEPEKAGVGLLKKEQILFKDEVKKKDGFLSTTSPSFYLGKSLYFLKFNDLILKVPNKEKDFYKLFESSADQVREFIKAHRYKIAKEEDLKEIIKFYNSL